MSDPAVSTRTKGKLDLFACGMDTALWYKGFDGEWQGRHSLGGLLTARPAAASWDEDRIDVFVRSNDSALWHKWYAG